MRRLPQCFYGKREVVGWVVLLGVLVVALRAIEAAPYAYVTTEIAFDSISVIDTDSISVIDTASNTVVATVPVGISPRGVAITPDGQRVYVTNYNSGSISVIDTASNTVVATVPVGVNGAPSYPRKVAITPDGQRAYVTHYFFGGISVIDTASNTVVAMVPVQGYDRGLSAVAITPDGQRAYIAYEDAFTGSGRVSVIDTASNTVVATVVATVPVTVHSNSAIAITPDGQRAYVTGHRLSVIDTASNTVVATVPAQGSPGGMAITPDGQRAYIAYSASFTGSGSISVIDTASNTVVATVPVGISPQGVAITPDGQRVYVTSYNSGSISVIDTASNTVVATVPVQGSPVGVAITPQVPSPPSDLTATRPCTSGEVFLTWHDNSENEDGWIIERQTSGEPFRVVTALISPNAPSFTDTGLTPGETYTYRVRAFNAVGSSVPSTETTVALATDLQVDIALQQLRAGYVLKALGWELQARVTDNDGFAVENVTFQERFVAKSIALPYFFLDLGQGARRCELKPERHGPAATPACAGDIGQSELVSVTIRTEMLSELHGVSFQPQDAPQKLVLTAIYRVEQVSPSAPGCLEVTQTYEFFEAINGNENPALACEGAPVVGQILHLPAHPEPPCARFKPTVTYEFLPGSQGARAVGAVEMAQRLHLRADIVGAQAQQGSTLAAFRDCDFGDLSCLLGFGTLLVDPLGARETSPGAFALAPEVLVPNVINAGDNGPVDNLHVTFKKGVLAPKSPPFFPGSGPTFDTAPGCPECVHLHWRWSTGLNPEPHFGGGEPLVPIVANTRSRQSMDLVVVQDHDEDPPDARLLVNLLGNIEALDDPVVWLIARSDPEAVKDTFFDYQAFVFASTDVAVTMTAAPAAVKAQGALTYTIRLTNQRSGDTATEWRFVSTFSSMVTLQSMTASPDFSASLADCSPPLPIVPTQLVTCTVHGQLLSGQTAEITMRVTPITLGVLRHTLKVEMFHVDFDPDNNQAIANVVVATSAMPDLEGDQDVDLQDIALINAALNQPANGSSDARDLDGDGRITVLDVRKAILRCTRPGCAVK